jgi:hypothetical protein
LPEIESADPVIMRCERGSRPEGREPGEMTIGEIRKYLERKIEVNKIMGVVYQLQYCGDIKELNPAEGPGRPTKKYQWMKGVVRIA